MTRTPNRFGGGSRISEYGLFFEQTTDLDETLRDAGFGIVNKHDACYNNGFMRKGINKRVFSSIFLSVDGINYLDYNSKHWDPDETFINELTRIVYVTEKESQSGSGSIDGKLATFPFRIYECQEPLDPIGHDIVYIYLLSSEQFDSSKYQGYYSYMDGLGYPHYFDVLPLSAVGL